MPRLEADGLELHHFIHIMFSTSLKAVPAQQAEQAVQAVQAVQVVQAVQAVQAVHAREAQEPEAKRVKRSTRVSWAKILNRVRDFESPKSVAGATLQVNPFFRKNGGMSAMGERYRKEPYGTRKLDADATLASRLASAMKNMEKNKNLSVQFRKHPSRRPRRKCVDQTERNIAYILNQLGE